MRHCPLWSVSIRVENALRRETIAGDRRQESLPAADQPAGAGRGAALGQRRIAQCQRADRICAARGAAQGGAAENRTGKPEYEEVNRTSLTLVALLGIVATASAAPPPRPATHQVPVAPPAATASPDAKAINELAPQAAAAEIESCIARTDALLAALDKGDYQGAEMDFNPTMQAGLPPGQLKQAWESLPARFGTPGPRGAPHNSLSGGYAVVTVPMPFESMMLAAQVACEVDGKIAGFHLMTLPAPEPEPAASAASSPASGHD